MLLTLLLSSCSKEVFNPGLTKEFTLVETATGAAYDIKVAVPGNFYSSPGKYSTIYVLDGKDNFAFVANKCQEISNEKGTKNVLVVSIGYGKDRSIDYTPTKMSSVTGGGPQFLNFIETKLIPKMVQDYNADTSRSSRVILGHSYGGLFGAYAFGVHNKVFGNYILLSPSLWFDNMVSFNHEKDNRSQNKDVQQLVFLGIGESEEVDRMKIPFETFYHTLIDNYTNMHITKHYESNAGHMNSRNPNIIKGLQYYFNNR